MDALARWKAVAHTVTRTVRTIIGAPDYEGYVAHVCAHHPEQEPMSQKDFERQRLADRYARVGGRCC